MADLDDFFAKKDRKKSKSKKFATAEELAKKIEDTKKQEIKPRKEPTGDGEDTNNLEERTEDEWKEFAEEERKDYTGLKIGQLQVNDDYDGTDDGDGADGGSDGEGTGDPSDRNDGPWKKVSGGETPTVAPSSQEDVPSTTQDKKLYVSPALRNQQLLKPIKLRKGVLPDINNEDYFPTLGATKTEEIKKKKADIGFEEVKHGGRLQRTAELPSSAPVTIGNRFNSLADS